MQNTSYCVPEGYHPDSLRRMYTSTDSVEAKQHCSGSASTADRNTSVVFRTVQVVRRHCSNSARTHELRMPCIPYRVWWVGEQFSSDHKSCFQAESCTAKLCLLFTTHRENTVFLFDQVVLVFVSHKFPVVQGLVQLGQKRLTAQ